MSPQQNGNKKECNNKRVRNIDSINKICDAVCIGKTFNQFFM